MGRRVKCRIGGVMRVIFMGSVFLNNGCEKQQHLEPRYAAAHCHATLKSDGIQNYNPPLQSVKD